jgi:hypothetical protein
MTTPEIGRRALLAAGSFGAVFSAVAPAHTRRPELALGKLPLGTQARHFVRMHSSIAGEAVLTNEGIIYGRVPGELPIRLFGFRSLLAVRGSEIAPDVFRIEQREAMHYHDLGSGVPLGDFVNPYTNEPLISVGYGSYARTLPAMREGSIKLDWRTGNRRVFATESRFNSFPAGITESEFPRAYAGPNRLSVDILTYEAAEADLAGPAAFVNSSLHMTSDGPWPYWLMMGRRPGGVLWVGNGWKYRTMARAPDEIKLTTEQVYPGFVADPWSFSPTEFGTAAQLRRLRAAGKI